MAGTGLANQNTMFILFLYPFSVNYLLNRLRDAKVTLLFSLDDSEFYLKIEMFVDPFI